MTCFPFKWSPSIKPHRRSGHHQSQWLRTINQNWARETSQQTFSFAVKLSRWLFWSSNMELLQRCYSVPLLDITLNSEQTTLSHSRVWFSYAKVCDIKKKLFPLFLRHHHFMNWNFFYIHSGWCTLTCKRIKKDQSIGQSIQYTLLPAFDEKFFSDVAIKSCDGYSVSMNYWFLCDCLLWVSFP